MLKQIFTAAAVILLGQVGAAQASQTANLTNVERFVSTITADGTSTSLSWTGLSGSDYTITCRNLAPVADTFVVEYGEGSPPTYVNFASVIPAAAVPNASVMSLFNLNDNAHDKVTTQIGTNGTSLSSNDAKYTNDTNQITSVEVLDFSGNNITSGGSCTLRLDN